MDDDDDNLPLVSLKSPDGSSSAFFMPDASVLVSQRKEARQQDILIETYRKEFIGDESESNPSSDVEISSYLNDLKLDKWNNLIRCENPGIDLLQIDTKVLCDCLNEKEHAFAVSTLNKFKSLNGENLYVALQVFTDMIEECINQGTVLKYGEILCFLLILCTVVLDKKCRSIVDIYRITSVVNLMLSGITLEHHVLASNVAHELLSKFKHFHDRLYLIENILIIEKMAPTILNTDPTQFAAKVAECMTFAALSELIGNEDFNSSQLPNSAFDVKELLLRGKKRKSLQPYEQYGILKFLNIVFDYLPTEYASVEDKLASAKAKRQIISIISSWNRNQGKSSDDVQQIKVLATRTKLIWEDSIKQNSQEGSEEC